MQLNKRYNNYDLFKVHMPVGGILFAHPKGQCFPQVSGQLWDNGGALLFYDVGGIDPEN